MKNKNKLKREEEITYINNDETWLGRMSRKEVNRKAEEIREQVIEC